jgi:hypothetical protein
MSHRHVLHEFMTGQTEEPLDNLRRDILISATVALILSVIFADNLPFVGRHSASPPVLKSVRKHLRCGGDPDAIG